jgi:hypothetical protein
MNHILTDIVKGEAKARLWRVKTGWKKMTFHYHFNERIYCVKNPRSAQAAVLLISAEGELTVSEEMSSSFVDDYCIIKPYTSLVDLYHHPHNTKENPGSTRSSQRRNELLACSTLSWWCFFGILRTIRPQTLQTENVRLLERTMWPHIRGSKDAYFSGTFNHVVFFQNSSCVPKLGCGESRANKL